MVDSGLDETSCYFVDDDGLQVEHGYLFLGGRFEGGLDASSLVLGNDSFTYDLSRRKVGWTGLREVIWVGNVVARPF